MSVLWHLLPIQSPTRLSTNSLHFPSFPISLPLSLFMRSPPNKPLHANPHHTVCLRKANQHHPNKASSSFPPCPLPSFLCGPIGQHGVTEGAQVVAFGRLDSNPNSATYQLCEQVNPPLWASISSLKSRIFLLGFLVRILTQRRLSLWSLL